jgi:osmotically-inducible protein OsmY
MSILSFRKTLDSDSIVHSAERKLHESPYFFLKNVSCRVDRGVLTLRGRVPFSPLKRFAESIVLRVEGVRSVVNQIDVYDPTTPALSVQEARSGG